MTAFGYHEKHLPLPLQGLVKCDFGTEGSWEWRLFISAVMAFLDTLNCWGAYLDNRALPCAAHIRAWWGSCAGRWALHKTLHLFGTSIRLPPPKRKKILQLHRCQQMFRLLHLLGGGSALRGGCVQRGGKGKVNRTDREGPAQKRVMQSH